MPFDPSRVTTSAVPSSTAYVPAFLRALALTTAALVASLALLPLPTLANTAVDQSWCDDHRSGYSKGVRECEVRALTLAASGDTFRVDGGRNGGVSVIGEDRDDIAVHAKVQVWGDTVTDARETMNTIRIVAPTGSAPLTSDGPRNGPRYGWSVSFRVFVPRQIDLELETHNGGVSIRQVHGTLRFDVLNGGVTLAGVGGDVQGHATNGGLKVELTGSSWDGTGLDAEATNGGVKIYVPKSYNAELVTGTVNGQVDVAFPVEARGHYPRRITTTLGAGGPTVKAITTNGGVQVVRY